MQNKIKKKYYCSVCQKQYEITLDLECIKRQKKFPFSMLVNHKSHKLILYIDFNGAIRGEEMVNEEEKACVIADQFENSKCKVMSGKIEIIKGIAVFKEY